MKIQLIVFLLTLGLSQTVLAQETLKMSPALDKEYLCAMKELGKNPAKESFSANELSNALKSCVSLSASPKVLKKVVRARLQRITVTADVLEQILEEVNREVSVMVGLSFDMCKLEFYQNSCLSQWPLSQ